MTPTQKTFPLLERKTSAQDVFFLPMTGAHIHVDSCLKQEPPSQHFQEESDFAVSSSLIVQKRLASTIDI